MSFNEYQLGYMRDLAKIPAAEKCYCAWFRLGTCPHCPPGLSAAYRILLECPECHNYPPVSDLTQPITHNIKCSQR